MPLVPGSRAKVVRESVLRAAEDVRVEHRERGDVADDIRLQVRLRTRPVGAEEPVLAVRGDGERVLGHDLQVLAHEREVGVAVRPRQVEDLWGRSR